VSPRNGQNPSVTVPDLSLNHADLVSADTLPLGHADLDPLGHPDALPCAHAVEARQQTILQVRHELRTPLAALRSFLELATEDGLEPAVVHECLEAIDRNVLRLAEALDRISVGDTNAITTPFRIDPTHLPHPSPPE
jgi:signal transduction histidine kinase